MTAKPGQAAAGPTSTISAVTWTWQPAAAGAQAAAGPGTVTARRNRRSQFTADSDVADSNLKPAASGAGGAPRLPREGL